jgi:putative oxidoreductase
MNTVTTANKHDDIGKLILRAALSVLILFHGIAKISGGVGFITGVVAKAGLPASLGYLVYVGEVIAPLLVLFGLWARAGAAVIAINMIVAILLVHTGDLFKLNQTGGWELELQAMFLATAIAVVFLGAGRYSLQGTGNRWN